MLLYMARQSEALTNCVGRLSLALDCATCLLTRPHAEFSFLERFDFSLHFVTRNNSKSVWRSE